MTDDLPLAERIVPYLTVGVWTFAVLLGGETQVGSAKDLLIQLVSAPLLVVALTCLFRDERYAAARRFGIVVIVLAFLVCLQLVPLPPGIWTHLGGRGFVTETYNVAGITLPWLPLSLAPGITGYALAALLPPMAVFLGMLIMVRDRQLFPIIIPIVVSTINVVLGVNQFSNVPGSDPAAVNVQGEAFGLFANRNHYAASNYVMIPLAIGWLLATPRGTRRFGLLWSVLAAGSALTFLLGLSLAYSRAGALIGVVTIALCGALYVTSTRQWHLPRWATIAIAAVILMVCAVFLVGTFGLVQERGAEYSIRGVFVAKSLAIIGQSPLFGYGLGSFVPLYMRAELPADIQQFYVNHAHNDWIEIVLETGLVGGALLILFAVWFVWRTAKIWTSKPPGGSVGVLALAASISAAGLLAHSIVDYPLRTTALATTFAACCALMAASGLGWRHEHRPEPRVARDPAPEHRTRSRTRRRTNTPEPAAGVPTR